MKKLATLLFAAILAFAMSMPVFAQDSGTAEGQTTAAPKAHKKHHKKMKEAKVKKEKKVKKSKKEKKSEEEPPAQ